MAIFDRAAHRERNIVARTINRITQYRRAANGQESGRWPVATFGSAMRTWRLDRLSGSRLRWGAILKFHASGAYGQWDTHVRGAKGGTMVAADQAVQTVDRVADFFILQVDEEAGDVMTSLRLQKLVYYAQSWHLALAGMPLFEEEFEAWVHGPVVPSLYFKYRGMSNASLPRPDGPPPEFVQRSLEILNDVWDEYGQYSAKRLEELTHAEDPWKDARRGHSPAELSNQVIPKDAMRVFYAARLPG